MKWCFHRRWHQPTPDQYIGLYIVPKIERLSRILTNFLSRYWLSRLANWRSPTSSLQVGSRYLAQIHCLVKSFLRSEPCLTQVSLCSLKQNSDPTLDSPGRKKHLNLRKKFVLRSIGFLTPNTPTSISRCVLSEKNGCKTTSKSSWYSTNEDDGPALHAWCFFWSSSRFLHIPLIGTNVLLPKIHKTPPDVDFFESSWSHVKSESCNRSQSTMLSRVTQMTILSETVCVMNAITQSC